ncbi:MAG: enoyl-CoA hydratase-related protein [Chloroflexota bacterium]|nr:enoyl-CoA hydratase-related protein [Chloroflexota bacterium]
MSDDAVLYDVQDHIATLTLNRPEKLNAFDDDLLGQWVERLQEAHLDDGVRVIVVTGAGRGFCSGANVAREGRGSGVLGDPNAPASNRNSLRNSVQPVPRILQNIEKPYIAAVNGAAVGAGMDMASMADIRIASDRAKFGMAYVRMGLVPGDGGAYWLPRIVGMATALELMWTGRLFLADEALAMGYVSKVVPHDDLIAETMEFAGRIAKMPAVSVQLIKRLAYRSAVTGAHEALEMAEHAMVIARSTEDAKEGPRAFMEKREPNFQGR